MSSKILRGTLCAAAAAVVISAASGLAQDDAEKPATAGKKPQNATSYLIGLALAQQMKQQGLSTEDVDIESFVMGFTDELSGSEPRLSDEELQAADSALRTMMQAKMKTRMEQAQKEMEAAAVANKEKADLFLQENAKKDGVKTLADGLQYKVEKAGTGASPTTSSRVKVHYTGKLLDGSVFDSSVQRGEPAVFGVNGLIQAWQVALPKMKVGDKWTLYAAPEMAYGMRGSPPAIGPNELLIFEMELLDIVE